MLKKFVQYWFIVYSITLISGGFWIWYSASHLTPPLEVTTLPHKDFMAPDFILPTQTGETIRLSDLRGKPVMINLWASWCLPCRAEMPSLQEVYEDYTGKGLVILAVNATNQDTLADVESFINTVGITFPVLLDTQGTASRDYQLSALPTTFFIGRDGIILDVVVGGPMSEALIRKRVDQLLETR